jgi:glutamate carboxypeptidase
VTPEHGSSSPTVSDIRRQVERSYDAYVSDLHTLVDLDCGTFVPEGVNRVAGFMQERFEAAGWQVARVPHSPGQGGEERLGDAVIARLAGDAPGGRRVLLVGHMDTVFPAGTAAERPFRVDGSLALGPGVSDMKGGLLAGLYAVTALQATGFGDFGHIAYVCNPDEEIGSPFSGPLILEQARDADLCLVLEGARENGDIVSARKGVTDVRISVFGRAAHAGVEPERGRSAILQAAHTILALHGLNGRWDGVTVNVGQISGGIRPNVVAERCDLRVDVRVPTLAAQEEVFGEIELLLRTPVVPETRLEMIRGGGFPPMEKTEATGKLVERAQAIASEVGFDLRDAATGGASDANPVAGIGVPVLDGLGPVGGGDHAPNEWLDLTSVVPRITLLAALIASGG